MFNKIKLKFTVISIAAVIVALLSQGTLAYYSTAYKTTNVVTSGDIQFIIHEKTERGENFPTDGVYIVPGDIVSKEVSFENICNHPFYLRVKLVPDVDSKELSADDWFKLDTDEKNWILKDGWYYYKGIVEPEKTTPTLFNKVEIIGENVDNNHLGKKLTLSVVAQAVQSENNPINDTDTYTASGWPKE